MSKSQFDLQLVPHHVAKRWDSTPQLSGEPPKITSFRTRNHREAEGRNRNDKGQDELVPMRSLWLEDIDVVKT